MRRACAAGTSKSKVEWGYFFLRTGFKISEERLGRFLVELGPLITEFRNVWPV
jgi:hypothetical protein